MFVRWAFALTVFVACGALALGGEPARRTLSLATAQRLNPDRLTATGRVVAPLSVRVGARLSAHIVSWGRTPDGRLLDAGDAVKAEQELFRLDATTFEDRARVAEAALKLAQAQLADLKTGEREERREALRATLAELDARIAENQRDEARFRRLVEQDKTMPLKRLEEVQLQRQVLDAQRRAAQARLDEAVAGPTPTQLAVVQTQVSQAQAHLESARLDLRDTLVKAPFAGVITRRFKSPGDYVANAPFIEVLELVATDQLEAELRLPERYYGRVAAGRTQVTLRSPLLPEALSLTVSRIIPEVDAAQGTFAFRVALPAAARGGLAPGTFLQGDIDLAGAEEGVVLPQRAVVERDGKPGVFVAAQGQMRFRSVLLGDKLSEGIVVRDGVRPGEQVLMGPPEELNDGAELPAYLKNP